MWKVALSGLVFTGFGTAAYAAPIGNPGSPANRDYTFGQYAPSVGRITNVVTVHGSGTNKLVVNGTPSDDYFTTGVNEVMSINQDSWLVMQQPGIAQTPSTSCWIELFATRTKASAQGVANSTGSAHVMNPQYAGYVVGWAGVDAATNTTRFRTYSYGGNGSGSSVTGGTSDLAQVAATPKRWIAKWNNAIVITRDQVCRKPDGTNYDTNGGVAVNVGMERNDTVANFTGAITQDIKVRINGGALVNPPAQNVVIPAGQKKTPGLPWTTTYDSANGRFTHTGGL